MMYEDDVRIAALQRLRWLAENNPHQEDLRLLFEEIDRLEARLALANGSFADLCTELRVRGSITA